MLVSKLLLLYRSCSPLPFFFAVFSSYVFLLFFKIPFHTKVYCRSAKGFMSKDSHEFLYAQSILSHTAVYYRQSHTLPKAVSHEAVSARRLPPTGRTPLALSLDAFARG